MEYQAHQTEANVFQRIATGGPATVKAAIEMLEDYGYEAPTNRKELAAALAFCAREKGEEVKKKMAALHPDRLFILKNTEQDEATQEYRNDCGCHHNDVGPLRTDLIAKPNDRTDIQQFALILVLGVGGLSFLMMIIGQVYLLHNKLSKNG
jgi:hypothetical protein